MAYAIYVTDSDNRQKITAVFPTSEAATAAADAGKGEVVFADALTDDIEPGWWLVNDEAQRLAPLTDAETIAEYREVLKANWRAREAEFRAAWAAHASGKASDYQRWIELNCRAINVDSNLSTEAQREALFAESLIPGADWHIQHSPTLWAAIFPDDSVSPPRTEWAYHATADGSGRHSRGGVADSAMSVDQDSEFDYVNFLHG